MISPALSPVWVTHARADLERARGLALELECPLAVAAVLVNRGVETAGDARRFLEPSVEDLHDPLLLLDLEPAMRRILRAAAEGERVLIYGDYDVDGITSTFLLYSALAEMGAKVDYRIPHRTRDGYGLSCRAIEQAHQRGVGLVVTVDCGITANEAVNLASTLGMDAVITDHHEPPAELPAAVAVVDPRRPGCRYPFKQLAGVGVTYKLVEAMLQERGSRQRAQDFLDLVAIGTIADVVPLVGENRILARAGLERLNRTSRLGLKALIEVAGLGERPITSGQVAFVLAPRLNAAGRMGNPEQGLRLLLARDAGEARACAESLEEDNMRRRQADEDALAEASAQVEEELGWPECASILLWSERWHPGVIGIVASRLVERYQRPALLVALAGERGRGSGRSLPGLDLNHLLSHCGDLVESYGGHALAAGLTVRRERLQELRERFEGLVRERLTPADRVPRLVLDGEMRLSECDVGLLEWLERMSPHGLDNPEPLFAAAGVTLESVGTVGGGKHLKLRVRDATGTAEAIGFGLGGRLPELPPGATGDIAFVPTRNEWLGQTRVQLKLKDVRLR